VDQQPVFLGKTTLYILGVIGDVFVEALFYLTFAV